VDHHYLPNCVIQKDTKMLIGERICRTSFVRYNLKVGKTIIITLLL